VSLKRKNSIFLGNLGACKWNLLKDEAKPWQDVGGSLGTIFESSPRNGVSFGAGFQNSCETYMGKNNRVVSFFIACDAAFTYEDIGNPFPDRQNYTRITTVVNQLYAINHNSPNQLRGYVEEEKRGVADESFF
jgi:hypothetical protein